MTLTDEQLPKLSQVQIDGNYPFYIRSGLLTFIVPGFKASEICIAHGKQWPEGDNFEETGGKACKECVSRAKVLDPHRCPGCGGDKFKTVIKGKLYRCNSLLYSNRGNMKYGCGWKGNTLLTLEKGGENGSGIHNRQAEGQRV